MFDALQADSAPALDMLPTRALTLLQPWAWAIFNAGKTIENRDWTACKQRGPIWIHTSKNVGARYFDESVDSIIQAAGWRPGNDDILNRADSDEQIVLHTTYTGRPRPGHVKQRYKPGPKLPRGAIVGRVDIVGTVDQDGVVSCQDGTTRSLTADEKKWWFGGFGLVLANPVALKEPVSCTGMLGFWRVGAEDLERCRGAL